MLGAVLIDPQLPGRFACLLNLQSPLGAIEASSLVGVALVLGGLSYSVHRAVIYPLIYRLLLLLLWLLGRFQFERRLLVPYLPAPLEVRLDRVRWQRGDPLRKAVQEWGAQVHFLYSTAFFLTRRSRNLFGSRYAGLG